MNRKDINEALDSCRKDREQIQRAFAGATLECGLSTTQRERLGRLLEEYGSVSRSFGVFGQMLVQELSK